MNYIPGFSNYLEASVPEYGPAPIMDAPRQAAVMPMTQEAAPMDYGALAGLDLSGLNSLYGMNFGSDFGGGAMGGQYQADPNLQYIAAPLSNKGNATGRSAGNTFTMTPDQPVRLVDLRTNQIVFEGTGYDAAREATRLGQSMTDSLGRKANYDIQTADPSGVYSTVANEKKNKSTLGEIANVVGTVAPLALGFVPGFGQLSLLAKVAAAAGTGGLGAALKGDNILKGALLGGATAGIASGTGLDKALGSALGGLGKGAVQGATQGVTQGLGSGAGDIVVTGLSKLAQGAGSAAANALVSNVGKAGLNSVSGSNPPPQNLAQQTPVIDYAGVEPIDVLAKRLASASGSPFAAAFPIPVSAMLAGTLNTAQPAQQNKTAEDIEAEKNPMVVNAYRPINPVGGFDPTSISKDMIGLGGSVAAGLPALTELAMDPTLTQPATEDIVVTGNKAIPKTVVPDTLAPVGSVLAGLGLQAIPTPDPALTKKPLGVEDYLSLAGKGVGLLGNIAGGGGSQGQAGTYTRGGGLNPIFSAKLPSAGGLGAIGANRTMRPMGDVDWLTYGTRPELNFYDYAAQNNPAPVTTPVPGNPAGPIMEERDPMAMAKGGRTEFAVNGPGTGRSDDIPAVLSDGEYVIDAETVALLGDGSSKAGAKKLDDLRVKVRKHKGQKLAKGRFSANAKKPEAYLSGGSI